MRIVFNQCVSAVSALLVVLAAGESSAAKSEPGKWDAHIDLEGKAGTDRNLGEADLFLPVFQNDVTLLFANLRTRMDDNDSREGNFGLGARHMLGSGWNLGGYGYFDRRRSETGHRFSQVTLGAEMLGEDWDFRANSYWPVGTTERDVDSLNAVSISGTSVTFRGGEEHALRGFDAEVGWRVPVFDLNGPLDLRVYVGGYTFDDADVPDVTGPRLRAEFTAYKVPELWDGARLTLGTEWQDDDVRGSQGFASLRLRIPLQSEKSRPRRLTAQERRMTAPIVRDVDIVSEAGAFGAAETATTMDGETIKVINGDNTTDLTAAVAGAGADATVMLSGSLSTTSEVTVQSGQTIMGGGNLTVKSPSGRTASLSLPSATVAATFSGATGNAVFEMANNSTLKDLSVTLTSTGGTAQAIDMTNVSNVTISNNTISSTSTSAGFAARAITADTVSNLTISNNTLKANADNHDATGISITNASTNNTIDNNKITVIAGANFAIGISLGSNVQTVVSNNTFTSSGGGLANSTMSLNSSTILAGSTNNVRSSASLTCRTTGTNTGSASFTDGSTCP